MLLAAQLLFVVVHHNLELVETSLLCLVLLNA